MHIPMYHSSAYLKFCNCNLYAIIHLYASEDRLCCIDNIKVNKKFRKFERKYRDCIKRNGDKIGTQTCYDIST